MNWVSGLGIPCGTIDIPGYLLSADNAMIVVFDQPCGGGDAYAYADEVAAPTFSLMLPADGSVPADGSTSRYDLGLPLVGTSKPGTP